MYTNVQYKSLKLERLVTAHHAPNMKVWTKAVQPSVSIIWLETMSCDLQCGILVWQYLKTFANRQLQIISHSQEYDCIKTDGELNQQTSSTVCRFSGQLDLLNHGCVWQLTLTNRKCTNHWIQQFRHQCHIIPKQIITNNTCSPVWGLQVISRSAT